MTQIDAEAIYAKWNGQQITTPGGCKIHVYPGEGDGFIFTGRADPDVLKKFGRSTDDLDATMTELFGADWRGERLGNDPDWRRKNAARSARASTAPSAAGGSVSQNDKPGKPVLDEAFAASIYARWNNPPKREDMPGSQD